MADNVKEHQEQKVSDEQHNEVIEDKNYSGKAKNYMPVGREAPIMSDIDFIKERVDDQIAYYNSKSSFNQKRFKKIKRWEIIISSLIPVIISLSAMGVFQEVKFGESKSWGLDTILLVIAALGGVVQVIFNKFIDLEEHYKLWKEYRLNCEALQNERILYLTRTEPYDEDDAYPLFVEKINSILNNEQQKWRQKQPPQNNKQQGQKNEQFQSKKR